MVNGRVLVQVLNVVFNSLTTVTAPVSVPKVTHPRILEGKLWSWESWDWDVTRLVLVFSKASQKYSWSSFLQEQDAAGLEGCGMWTGASTSYDIDS